MTYRLPALSFALICMAVLGGCHTAKSLIPDTLIPPNLRPPAANSGDALKLAQKKLQDASPCCSSFADFSYQTILPWQPQKFVLGSDAMVANLNGAHSYFLAFRLPTGIKLPYRVALKSELNGRWLSSSYLFAPTVVTLDEGFQPLATSDITLCEHVGWGSETTGAFGAVTIKDEKARYLLVYSSAGQQSGKTYWEQSPAAATTNTTGSVPSVAMNASGTFSVPHGPDGTLWVGMMDKTYAKAVDNAICKKPPPGTGVLNTLRDDLPIPWINTSKDTTDGSSKSDDGKSTQ
jgi:maltose operon protein